MNSRFLLPALLALPFLAACHHNDRADRGTRDGDWSRQASASPGMVNTKCPISGEALSADSPTTQYHGKTVGLCCAGCAAKFNAMSDADKQARLDKAK